MHLLFRALFPTTTTKHQPPSRAPVPTNTLASAPYTISIRSPNKNWLQGTSPIRSRPINIRPPQAFCRANLCYPDVAATHRDEAYFPQTFCTGHKHQAFFA
ncbi:hypothetical protein ACJQWK_05021 [Exserohilum turcicum]|uniref:Uncharacterized protein n=1 Tax=Exserohilum turcicum (strain 28A) TaxID=671987 RepID=R0JKL8_EXST2|nr:uncharacterized protein SETTUDRAFT_165430 [Exserohilum turcica Et28A]EOA81843.1 hypothetical protein SETTUDRAFT_165430 [Exserohilum turcica Et28A]